jgi:predicted nucleic acid-binding protein
LTNLFLDSNILIDHFCNAGVHLCSEQLLNKIRHGDHDAWVTDFVYSETLGEIKNRLEKKKGLKASRREVISKFELARIIKTIEIFKKTPHLESATIPLDQTMIYDRVKESCIEAKDAPIILCVEQLQKKMSGDVYLVTADMHSLFFKAQKFVKTLHPSFHMNRCTSECRSYYSCNWKNRFTRSRSRRA